MHPEMEQCFETEGRSVHLSSSTQLNTSTTCHPSLPTVHSSEYKSTNQIAQLSMVSVVHPPFLALDVPLFFDEEPVA